MSTQFNITDSSVSNLAKRKYAQKSLNMYNGLIPALGLVKKTFDNVGERVERAVPTGYAGGASFGSLGTANRPVYEKAYFTTKSVYCVAEIDRRTIKQFTTEGAFVDGIQETMKKTVEKFNWLMDYTFTGPGTGALGTIDSLVDTNPTFVLTITTASWVKARWEVREHVNIGTGTDRFEITAVNRTTRAITVVRRSGSYTPAAADVVYIDGGLGNTPQGLLGALSATTSTLYGITVADRWQSYQLAAGGAGISPDIMNQAALGVWDNVGISPTAILTSVVQMRKLLSSIEDQKQYNLEPTKLAPRAENLVGKVSFSAVQFMTVNGAVPIIVDRFVPDDTMMFVNFDECEIAHSDQGWFDDEGFIFLRAPNSDSYQARYGGYLEDYIPPTVCGIVTGLATS